MDKATSREIADLSFYIHIDIIKDGEKVGSEALILGGISQKGPFGNAGTSGRSSRLRTVFGAERP